LIFDDTSNLALQVRLLIAGPQRAFASVQGWYFPDLGSAGEITGSTGFNDMGRG
jgi:hypothetical protein